MSKNVKIRVLTKLEDGKFKVLGGQRSASLEEENDPVDMTSEDSDGFEEYDYGLGSWTVSCDGVYVVDNEAFDHLKDAIREKKKLKVQISEDGKSVDEGEALVTSRSIEGAYDSETTYECEFQGSGKLKKATSNGDGSNDDDEGDSE